MAARSWWVTALIALTAGCSAALTPLTSEQTTGLKEAQRIAEHLEGHSAVRWVRYPFLTSHPQYDLAKRQMSGGGTVVTFELDVAEGAAKQPTEKLRAVIADKERAANHRGVEILVRFLGLTEREALERYATYLIAANRSRNGRNVLIPFGHPLPCVQLRDLWASFGQTAPACELQAAPDDSAAVTPDDRLP